MPCARELGLERRDQLAVLAVDRADAAEELVVVRDLLEPLARDVAAAGDVLEERHHVVHPLGPAERDDEQRVVAAVRHAPSVAPEKLGSGRRRQRRSAWNRRRWVFAWPQRCSERFCSSFSASTESQSPCRIGPGAISSLGIAFAFGLGLALAIGAFGHISGGHFNPAVSLGLAVARKFPPREVVPYWVAQLVGGFFAVLAVAIVYSESAVDALNTHPGPGISGGGAFLLEVISTALFVMLIATVATDDRAPWKGVMAPLLIGLFIFTAANAVGPASGGSFNPARSIDPAIYNVDWGDMWIYIFAPLIGGIIGGAVRVYFGPAPETSPRRSGPPAGCRRTQGTARTSSLKHVTRRSAHWLLTLPVVLAGIEAAHALANSLTGAPATEVFESAASGRGALEPLGLLLMAAVAAALVVRIRGGWSEPRTRRSSRRPSRCCRRSGSRCSSSARRSPPATRCSTVPSRSGSPSSFRWPSSATCSPAASCV